MYTLFLGSGIDRAMHASAIAEIEGKFQTEAATDVNAALIIIPNMVRKIEQHECSEARSGQLFGQEHTFYYFLMDFSGIDSYVVFQDLFGATMHCFSKKIGYRTFTSEKEMREALA